MSTTMTETAPSFTTLELRSAYGPVFRQVSTSPPRNCTADEIPVIDISGAFGDFDARKQLADEIKTAAENIGFFYIKNHGIDKEVIDAAHEQALKFFKQDISAKELVHKRQSKFYNGYSGIRSALVNRTENPDRKEGFQWRYDPRYDPDTKDLNAIPEEVKPFIRGEEFVWEGTSHLSGFKDASLTYWKSCLTLARRLVRIFALALDLPEEYFDKVTTYPGSDGVYNFYPAVTEKEAALPAEVGIGSHTDLQCFTLLWQDMVGGLQVLNKNGQWIKATPMEGSFVVNIGDFLQRLSNDKFKSTVHRVYNRAPIDRISMPFFFGFNFNETCSVLPTCTDENNPPKYDPISCGEWCQLRMMQASNDMAHLEKGLPLPVIAAKA